MNRLKQIIAKIVKCWRAIRHEWRFGGPVEGYLGEYSQQPFRITSFVGREPYNHNGYIRYGGMTEPYYGCEIYNDGLVSFVLKKHSIDKYGRVRYFDKIPDGYIDVLENINVYDKDNIVNLFNNKKPKWEYVGFLAEDDEFCP